jgi:hypothetical protein
MMYVLLGIGAGVMATFGVGRVMRGMLYGVEPHDPSTIAVIAVGLTVAALVACCVPATKAARVDPVVALDRTRRSLEPSRSQPRELPQPFADPVPTGENPAHHTSLTLTG